MYIVTYHVLGVQWIKLIPLQQLSLLGLGCAFLFRVHDWVPVCTLLFVADTLYYEWSHPLLSDASPTIFLIQSTADRRNFWCSCHLLSSKSFEIQSYRAPLTGSMGHIFAVFCWRTERIVLFACLCALVFP